MNSKSAIIPHGERQIQMLCIRDLSTTEALIDYLLGLLQNMRRPSSAGRHIFELRLRQGLHQHLPAHDGGPRENHEKQVRLV